MSGGSTDRIRPSYVAVVVVVDFVGRAVDHHVKRLESLLRLPRLLLSL